MECITRNVQQLSQEAESGTRDSLVKIKKAIIGTGKSKKRIKCSERRDRQFATRNEHSERVTGQPVKRNEDSTTNRTKKATASYSTNKSSNQYFLSTAILEATLK